MRIARRSATGGVGRPRLRLGVSSCLLGERVRYDGGHKRDRFVCGALGRAVEWVPVCPELEAGLGVPRPPMRLVREGDTVRLVEIASGRDHTRALVRTAAARLRALRALGLSGYVLKRNSPSCGPRVKAVDASGARRRAGAGVFARALREAFPGLPIVDESQLRDAAARKRFLARATAYARRTMTLPIE